MTNSTQLPHARLAVGIIAGLVLAVLAVVVVTLNRGFDFGDEGFVYAMAASNRGAAGEFWGFQHLVHPVYELLGSSILALRVLRLIGYVGLGVLLTVVAHRTVKSLGVSMSQPSWIIVALMAQIGTMAAWGYPPRYLGYNELSSWFAQVGGALMLLVLARAAGAERGYTRISSYGPWVAFGVILSLLVFAKITSAIVFAVFLVAVIMLARRPVRALGRVVAVVAGALGTFVVLALIGVPVADYISRIVAVLLDPTTQEESGYSIGSLFLVYVISVMSTARELIVVTTLLLVVLLSVRHGLRSDEEVSNSQTPDRTHLLRRAAIVVAVLLGIMILLPQVATVWNGLGIDITLLLVVAVVALVAVGPRAFALTTERYRRTIFILGILILIATPFMNAVGTNNAIVGQTVFSATLWAVAAGVGLCLLWERSPARGLLRFLPAGIAIALVLNGAIWVAGDVLQHPYQTDPYLTQKTSVSLPEFAGMRVSESDAALLEWLEQTAKEENAADVPTTVMANSGALLAFNNSNWASPWMGTFSGPSLTRSCLASPPEELLLLQPAAQQPGSESYDAVVSGLAGCDIEFPEDFTEVSEHKDDNPYRSLTLWRFER